MHKPLEQVHGQGGFPSLALLDIPGKEARLTAKSVATDQSS